MERLSFINTGRKPGIVHLILGLPEETSDDMYASVSYLNEKGIFGIKLQLLHILKGTDLAPLYLEQQQTGPTKLSA